jgi:hypothetical protein
LLLCCGAQLCFNPRACLTAPLPGFPLHISPASAGPGSPRAAAVDLNRLDNLLEGADLPSDDEEDEDYE